jgi:exosome complex RNA-binding protein Rrp4
VIYAHTRPHCAAYYPVLIYAPNAFHCGGPGHGTFLREDGSLVASVSGVVEYVDKLVMVRPPKTRYVASTAAVGDVVVGRVVETVLGRGQRWKLDINSQQVPTA